MKKLTRQISILLMLTFFSNLSYSQISSEYDKSADFSNYKTFTFAPWQAGSDKVLNDIDKNTLETAMTNALAERGVTKVDSSAGPDLYITIYMVIKNEQATTAYTTYNGGLGMGYGVGWGYGMGSATTTYSEDDYQEGTTVVDFYDFKSKKLVWQGTIQGVVQSANKRDKTIPKKVNQLMQRYPIKPSNK